MPSKYDGASEKEVSSEIVAALKALGFDEPYTDTPTGFFLRTEQKNRKKRKNHESPGISDFLVRKHVWPVGQWLHLEAKGREHKPVLEPAQKVLAARDGIVVVTSAAEQSRL